MNIADSISKLVCHSECLLSGCS